MDGMPWPAGPHLGVDVGTSNTAAVLRLGGGEIRPLLFDGIPLLPSAVFVDGETVLVGADAYHAARSRPQFLEPNPKRRVDDGAVLLGDRPVEVERLLAAILDRVRAEARRTAGAAPARLTLTYPATWGPRRLAVLTAAAGLAGLPAPATVYEPVSAAARFLAVPGIDLPPGRVALVYDLGAGTFDVTLLRRTPDGFDVVASQGLPDVGGLDLDATIVASINAHLRPDDPAWRRLRAPGTPADFRARRELWSGVRAAKEMLSRATSTSVYVPLLDAEVPLGREQFEALAGPLLERTVTACRAVARDAGVGDRDVAVILLVGGSTRIPLVSTVLHRAFGRPPVSVEQPDLVVAYGSVSPTPPPAAPPAPPAAPPPLWPAAPAPAVSASPAPRRYRWRIAATVTAAVLAAALAVFAMDRYRDSAGGAKDAGPSTSPPAPSASTTPPAPSPTAAPVPAALVIPAAFGGRWRGTASQRGGVVSSWTVVLTLPAGQSAGRLEAPTLRCVAELTVVAPAPTDRELYLRQRTTADPRATCAQAAEIQLVVNSAGRIDMFWQDFESPTNTALATLSRA